MKADIFQARRGLWFVWSDLQTPSHVLSPRLSIVQVWPDQRGCTGLVFTQRMSWALCMLPSAAGAMCLHHHPHCGLDPLAI